MNDGEEVLQRGADSAHSFEAQVGDSVRVLEIVRGFGRGGAERALINRLSVAPESMETFIFNSASSWNQIPGAPVANQEVKHPYNILAQVRDLRRSVLNFRPHVVVARTPHDLICVRIAKASLGHDFKLVYEAHSEFVTRKRSLIKLVEALHDWAIVGADEVFAVSRTVASGRSCRAARHVEVMPVGCKVNRYAQPRILNHRGPTLLYLGRLEPVKRVPWLIDRLAAIRGVLSRNDAHVFIVGQGSQEGLVRARVHDLFMGELVTCVPWSESPDSFLAASDSMLFASETEGLPLSAMEAKRLGLRLVATPLEGLQEISDDQDIICTTADEHAFEAAMIKSLLRGKLTRQVRNEKWEKTERLDYVHCATRFYAHILEAVLSNRSASPN